MSKSLDNCIYLDDTDQAIEKKLATAFTDPARKRRIDPGNPDVCNIMSYHRVFSTPEEIEHCADGCRSAGIGCVDCKKILTEHVLAMVAPIRDRRLSLLARTSDLEDILRAGAERARPIAQATMREVRTKIGVSSG
jgi:tryptophanyl-tRNA synthetase